MTSSEMTPLELVVSKLEAAGCEPAALARGTYEARCPVHQDPKKSLVIQRFAETGPVFLFCSLGGGDGLPSCSTEAVVAALGLRLGDLNIQAENTEETDAVWKPPGLPSMSWAKSRSPSRAGSTRPRRPPSAA